MISTQQLLPPISQPPHDPTSWLLTGENSQGEQAGRGWRAAKLVHLSMLPPRQSLTLELEAGSKRSLFEINGSFGGLTVPANVALGPDDSVYLLDATDARLKRFDPCECDFLTVPCFGGVGPKPRELNNAHGIAICSGNLFVCDTLNHRLSVFSLNGFVLRGFWKPPASAYAGPTPTLVNEWEPFDLAFDRVGRLFVTDQANGCVHVFGSSGQWQKAFTGLGAVQWIAIDCHNKIYVVIDGPPAKMIELNLDGSSVEIKSTAEEMAPRFPRKPFSVDAEGQLHLGHLCPELRSCECPDTASPICPPHQVQERGLFDALGNQVIKCAEPPSLTYLTSGVFFSEPLDSELYRCQWHRVILRGEIPAGARVVVSTFTAEATLTNDQIQLLTEDEWDTKQTASELTKGDWDCLVRSGGGRFLWLRLEFFGNSRVSPRIDSVEIEFPRISLRRYLPAVFGEEATSADFTDRFLSLFDTTLRSVETKLDHQARYYDPLSTPSERDPKTGVDFLNWLASWIGVALDRNWSEYKRRTFLKKAGSLFDLRGTREGLWRELLVFLDMEQSRHCSESEPRLRCRPDPANCAPPKPKTCHWEPPPLILEHFKLRRWLFLGAGRIGDQAVLWGKRILNRSQLNEGAQVAKTQLISGHDPYRDPFHYYAHKFSVFVPACYRESEGHRKSLENLLRAGRPAATLAQIQYVEPRFRIGFQSMVGFDSVVGRHPSGVTLDQTSLSGASVLTAAPHKQGGPSLEIGKQSRIGATTRLE